MRQLIRDFTFAAICLALLDCHRHGGIPEPGSPAYRDLVSAFYVGVAGLQAGEDVRARQGLTRASQIAPGEPASWANLGLLEIRQQQYDQALKDLETARSLEPQNSHVEILLGLVESKRGNVAAAVDHLKRAVSLDPKDLKAIYALAQETERLGNAESDRTAGKLLGDILLVQPNNIAVILDQMRLAAKLGDSAAVKKALGVLRSASARWPAVALHQLAVLETAASTDVRSAAVQVQFLRNVLLRNAAFRQDQDAVRPPAGTLGEPFVRFVKIAAPSSLPAPSDQALRFENRATAAGSANQDAIWVGSIILDAKSDPRVIWADQNNLHLDQGTTLALPARVGSPPKSDLLSRNSVAWGDLNYDFKSDVVIATQNGVRIYQQGLVPLFSDVTAKTKLPSTVINGSYSGAWLFDVDLDGDLDVVLGTPAGDPVVLRNNGDGTFAVIRPFSDLNGVRDFAAADVDGDGDPDVLIVDREGRLNGFSNQRLGNYVHHPVAIDAKTSFSQLVAADINGDGFLDFVGLATDNRVFQISGQETDAPWSTALLVSAKGTPAATPGPNLLVADLDNNGSLDLVVGYEVFLHDGTGFKALPQASTDDCRALLDLNGDGRLDVVALRRNATGAYSTTEWINRGQKNYRWQTLRTRASQTTGDQRINSYGIGGEVEIRSGLLTQKQSITAPLLHFGLGENASLSLARIVWPNGALQVEFDLKPDATALAQQRLKGSCPFLFAWNGLRMQFVKDCAPWSPALGLHVNAQKVAGIYQTQEWFKIPGNAVQPRNGYYDIRITAEYWETFYIDHYSFLAVDHPEGTEVFADERFAVPPPPLKLYGTRTLRPFAKAMDDNGKDVSAVVATLDQRYLDTFGRGAYQGVTRDHWVELELPLDAPIGGPLYLIGSGWVHPTDATVNIALGQGSGPAPRGMSIELQDETGRWRTARDNLGFPAGRVKDVVLDLGGLFTSKTRRLRLRTNLEIYWDRLGWTTSVADEQLRVQRLSTVSATLNYRGFSRMLQADRSSPELPDYDRVEQRGPRWRDLEGYYTRFGDVSPLLKAVDDRMLITNAGDELRLQVSAGPKPPEGWTRDLILIGDGWIKDGDYNSVFSKTVLPLPYHGLQEYTVASPSLEEDAAYKLHPGDWAEFHTRFVAPQLFTRALWQ